MLRSGIRVLPSQRTAQATASAMASWCLGVTMLASTNGAVLENRRVNVRPTAQGVGVVRLNRTLTREKQNLLAVRAYLHLPLPPTRKRDSRLSRAMALYLTDAGVPLDAPQPDVIRIPADWRVCGAGPGRQV
jgi:hypothetical protein